MILFKFNKPTLEFFSNLKKIVFFKTSSNTRKQITENPVQLMPHQSTERNCQRLGDLMTPEEKESMKQFSEETTKIHKNFSVY